MAKKKAAASAPKAAAKKSAVKKSAPKAAAPKASATKKSAPKKSAPKSSATKTSTPKKSAPKKKASAAVKLTDRQVMLLGKVAGSKESGYLGPKAEGKTLESLQTKKLIKRGTKDKESGSYRYLVTKSGEKHLVAPSVSPGA